MRFTTINIDNDKQGFVSLFKNGEFVEVMAESSTELSDFAIEETEFSAALAVNDKAYIVYHEIP